MAAAGANCEWTVEKSLPHRQKCDAEVILLESSNLQPLMSQFQPRAHIVVVNRERDLRRLRPLFTAGGIPHLADEESAARTLRALLAKRGVGLEDLMQSTASTISLTLSESGDKGQALQQVAQSCAAVDLGRRIQDTIIGVADELISNAFFNAPTNADGTPRHRHQERAQAIKLRKSELIQVDLSIDSDAIALQVSDPFGSLKVDTFRAHMERALAEERPTVQAAGSAGMGLYMALAGSNHLVVTIQPGRCTQMLSIVERARAYREFAEKPKRLDMFLSP
jgi:hypothetical protein